MSDESPKFLLNTRTGAILPATPHLLKRTDLFPCTEDGKPISAAYSAPDENGEVEAAPFLLNPVNGAVIAYSPLLARKAGMVPVQSQEHANQVLAELDKPDLQKHVETSNVVPISPEKAEAEEEEAPEEQPQAGLTDPASDVDEDEEIELGVSAEEMADSTIPDEIADFTDPKKLKAYMLKKYQTKLDGRLTIDSMKESAATIINNSSEAAQKALDTAAMT